MSRYMLALLSILILPTVSLTDTTVEKSRKSDRIARPKQVSSTGTIYNPQIEFSIPYTFTGNPMSVVGDGSFYYMNNGSQWYNGVIEKFALDGGFVQSVTTNLDGRGFFYNPNDGEFYIKDYNGPTLFQVDPNTGASVPILTGIFHSDQSCLAYDPASNLMYELSMGTVYAIDLATGTTINSWSGVTGSYAIAYNGCHFITRDWDSEIYVYDTDFNFVESHTLWPGGTNPYSLSFANGLLWEIEFLGLANGYSGVQCGTPLCVDVEMTSDADSVSQGGTFPFDGSLTNNTGEDQTINVWLMIKDWKGTFYPTACNVKDLTINDGATLMTSLVLNVPGTAPPGNYTLMAYVGYNGWSSCNSFGLTFTVTSPQGSFSTGNDEWTVEGGWDSGVVER